MYIIGLGTAVPVQRYAQRQCWDALCASDELGRLSPRSQAILRKVLNGDNGIVTRHLALDPLSEAFNLTPDATHLRFALHAPALAVRAAQEALQEAHCEVGEIDALLISTCTGYMCPGLTSYVSERLGMRIDANMLDLVGQGCGAALPNLWTADALLAAGRAQKVLSICVEVCSAAFYLDNDPGVLISACLFGDGAGAAVLSSTPNGGRKVRWKNGATRLAVAKRETLRFEQKNGMLRNILSQQVPELASDEVKEMLSSTLRNADIGHDDVKGWILHSGGREVLQAMQGKLELEESDLRHTAAVLSEFGNISSPTVLFVLKRALNDSIPDGLWWMSSFGAGFSCHGSLLEVSST